MYCAVGRIAGVSFLALIYGCTSTSSNPQPAKPVGAKTVEIQYRPEVFIGGGAVQTETLTKFEARLAYPLPKSYRDFLVRWNGASFPRASFGNVGVGDLIGFLPPYFSRNHGDDLRDVYDTAISHQLDDCWLPIGRGLGAGDWLFLNLRNGRVHQSYDGWETMRPVADSFSSFLSGLYVDYKWSDLGIANEDVSEFHDAIANLDRDWIRKHVGAYPTSLNDNLPNGDIPLVFAVRHGFAESALLLLELGASPHVVGERGETLFHLTYHPILLERLVVAGGDINRPDRKGETPLAAAARIGLAQVLVRLLLAGARFDFNSPDAAVAEVLQQEGIDLGLLRETIEGK